MLYAGALAAGAFAGRTSCSSATRSTRGFWAFVAIALAGTIGYTLGSIVGWAIGVYGGRPLLERHGRWFHLVARRSSSAPSAGSTAGATGPCFLGRITPVVRSFISIPAGVFRMPLGALHGADVPRLDALVLRVRGRRLGPRHAAGRRFHERLPLRRLRGRRPRSSRGVAYLLVRRRRSSSLARRARFRSLTSRRSTRR